MTRRPIPSRPRPRLTNRRRGTTPSAGLSARTSRSKKTTFSRSTGRGEGKAELPPSLLTARQRIPLLLALWGAVALLIGGAPARADDNSQRLSVIEENDSLFFDSDRHYTQGL